jgi:excisionase family DNA binding protein
MAGTDRPISRPILTGVGRPTNLAQSEPLVIERRLRRLLPIGAAADYLSVSRARIERLVNRGELPIVRVAGSIRYDVEDLDGYIDVQSVPESESDRLKNVTLSRGKGRDCDGA